jgi:cytochrome c oxidase subunit 3
MSTAAVANKRNKWMGGESPFDISYGKMMMWFFLMSDAFTFGAFLISYGTTRFFSNIWPDPNAVFWSFPIFQDVKAPGSEGWPLMFVSLMTFILILSSVTMVLAVHAGHCRDKKGVVKWMIWTILGGIAFLSCQAYEWQHLLHEGGWWGSFRGEVALSEIEHFFKHGAFTELVTTTDAGAAATIPVVEGADSAHKFFNFFFTITGFHGFHVFSGVVINIIILVMTINGAFEKRGHYETIEKAGLYWHFVDLVWVFVFTCFYLL